MVKAPDMDTLIRNMEKLEEYGLSRPLNPPAAAQPLRTRAQQPAGLLQTDITFVNDAYDSRKTGIGKSTPSPSAYRLCMGSEFISFMCDKINTQPHGHLAIQLAFNFDAPFQLRMNGSRAFHLFFFTIPANTPHQLVSPAGKHLSILLDPVSALGRRLSLLSQDQNRFLAYHRSVIERIYPHIRARLAEFETNRFLNSIISNLLSMMSDMPEFPMDNRIENAIARCRINEGKDIGTRDLAEWTALSESRARHLFKEETGVLFTRYLKWLKTMAVLKHTSTTGSTLTEAAQMSGFSDSAHLSRTFRELFGLMPSSVLK